ncbi:hypothetical protein ACXR2U_15925 [Jatrophihabitans sp. YIM 134969]
MNDNDAELRSRSNLKQLAGPGVPGLEQDPPLYHFDVDAKDAAALHADPHGFLARLGLGPEQGIAPARNVRVTWTSRFWTSAGWKEREELPEAIRNDGGVSGCCYGSDDEIICHPHG